VSSRLPARARGTDAVLDVVAAPVLVLSGTGRVLYSNRAAQILLDLQDGLQLRDGYFEDDEVEGYHFPSFGPSFGDQMRGASLHYDIRTGAVDLGGHLSWLSASIAPPRWGCRSGCRARGKSRKQRNVPATGLNSSRTQVYPQSLPRAGKGRWRLIRGSP
jgi:PAS domain-containing protein